MANFFPKNLILIKESIDERSNNNFETLCISAVKIIMSQWKKLISIDTLCESSRSSEFFRWRSLTHVLRSASSTSPRWNFTTILVHVNKPRVCCVISPRRREEAGLRTSNVLSLEFRDGSDTVWDRPIDGHEIRRQFHVSKVLRLVC